MIPDSSVMRNTCTATLYDKLSYDTRAILDSDEYREVFPKVCLSRNKSNLAGWNTNRAKQVSYYGAGVTGSIMGFGAGLAVTDDMYKSMDDALSETVNTKIKSWKQSAHNSRMEKNCPEIFIGTRWTGRDIIGEAIESGDLRHIVTIPALIKIDGEEVSFCDDVKSTKEYLKIRVDTEESIWLAEYMQEPAEIKGLLFPLSSLKLINPTDYSVDASDYRLLQIDPADKGGDYLAGGVLAVFDDRVVLHDVIFNTDGTDITLPQCIEMVRKYKVNNSNTEGNGGWVQFGKDLRRGVESLDCPVRIYPAITHKQTRILAQSAFIKNHFWFRSDYKDHREYCQFMTFLGKYLKEGTNQKDDAPDMLAGASQYLRSFLEVFK